jgi:DTW domain-containing protein YfiP
MSEPTRPIRSRRLSRCGTCGLNEELCGCAALPRLEARTEVVVLLHRLERFKSSNTGKLAARMLARGQAIVASEPIELAPSAGSYVLFPHASAISLADAQARGLTRLIVPDGTWPQAGRLARRDPRCAGLPCVTLETDRPSAYGLRRSDRPSALSTLEAIAEALRILEGDAIADPMHHAFASWVARSQRVRHGAHLQRDP